jgi:hypothetical protein
MVQKNSKMLIMILSVLMVGLIVSTAPATVAAGDWGNLDAGNEIKWKVVPDPVSYPDTVLYMTVDIVGISGTDMTYNFQVTVVYDSSTSSWSGTDTDDEMVMFVYSQSYLQKEKADAEADASMTWESANHNWKGTNYKTHHLKWVSSGDNFEQWIDTGSGITLELTRTIGGTAYTIVILESTTAKLTKAGFCLGTVLIAFVSVATLVSYSLARYQKKKRT